MTYNTENKSMITNSKNILAFSYVVVFVVWIIIFIFFFFLVVTINLVYVLNFKVHYMHMWMKLWYTHFTLKANSSSWCNEVDPYSLNMGLIYFNHVSPPASSIDRLRNVLESEVTSCLRIIDHLMRPPGMSGPPILPIRRAAAQYKLHSWFCYVF